MEAQAQNRLERIRPVKGATERMVRKAGRHLASMTKVVIEGHKTEPPEKTKRQSVVRTLIPTNAKFPGKSSQQEDLTRGEMEQRRKSVSDVEMNVQSVAAFANVKVRAVDMPALMQAHAFRCARRAYDGLEKFSTKHMAFTIKKEFDKIYGPAWHCIVGSSFGSFVTHSTGCFIYFSMDEVFILLFKTRVQRATK